MFPATCPVCSSPDVVRLPDGWDNGNVIPLTGCGNPWHYADHSLGDSLLVLVRADSGGIRPDGTTNTSAIDFTDPSAPMPPDACGVPTCPLGAPEQPVAATLFFGPEAIDAALRSIRGSVTREESILMAAAGAAASVMRTGGVIRSVRLQDGRVR